MSGQSQFGNLRSILIVSILSLVLFSACLSPVVGVKKPSHPCSTSLRVLDPADAVTPAYDMTAVYLHRDNENLQIRIDLLDFQSPNELSLDIRISDDSTPGATPLDLHIPSESDADRISLGPLLDTVVVEVPLSTIPSRPRVDVSTPEDKISGLTLDGPVPSQTAPLLLTFYNAFAGRFPAEALRYWDGAHSGPRGERHGLKYLLDAAEKYRIPIVLLDLKTPENLSALDTMGLLPRIQQIEQEGILILPDQPEQESIFGFSLSPFTWDTMESRPTFVISDDRSHIYQPLFSKRTLIPIAAEIEDTQPTPDGPSLAVRRALLDIALNTDKKDILVLGGNFQNTNWGSLEMAGSTLAYFASRPYIHILSTDELLDFPTRFGKPEILPSHLDDSIDTLKSHYQNLTQPVLNFAANWAGSPISTCGSDVDKDGQLECILAGNNYLAILDPQGARLTYLFTRGGDSLHQLIGPSWQVAVGLSDLSTWNLSAGEAADLGAYPGAFTDADDPFKQYKPVIEENMLVFTALDGPRTKIFKLTDTGIEVKYQTQETITTQIPLLVDPDTRFTPGWANKYFQQNTLSGVTWGLENGPMVSLQVEEAAQRQAQGDISLSAFNDTLSLLNSPEDPDFDYPPGHYVPFPMAIVDVKINGDYSLSIERK